MKEKILKIKRKIIDLAKKTPKKRWFIYFGVFLISIPVFYGFVTFSRYVFKTTYNNFLLTKEFYFNSDILKDELTPPHFVLEDWDGESDYNLTIDIKNFLDEYRWTKESINYNVSVSCDPSISGNVTCTANNGTITSLPNGGSTVNINVLLKNDGGESGTPLVFTDEDYVNMEIVVQSTYPYKKTLKADFRVGVTLQNIKYMITDVTNQTYFDFYLSNYGDTAKNIELRWDYTIVNVDMTNTYVRNGTPVTSTVDGKSYISGNNLTIGARKSMMIRFYKTTASDNWTYPITNNTSIVTVRSATP